ncbi:hypothetical protein T07_5515 [Trichinella nelsoni]|uniref:Uncharacterized protein n=1 Tax=Trichinella nelsoni TaxID=6336 RepID=A0A0V0RHB8_9BILA|nr:hypothetical protein T07_5515 [Trichinella nelsoni]
MWLANRCNPVAFLPALSWRNLLVTCVESYKCRILAAGRLLCVHTNQRSQRGAFTACSQSAQRLVFDSVALSYNSKAIEDSSDPKCVAGIPLNRKWPVELAERPLTPAL